MITLVCLGFRAIYVVMKAVRRLQVLGGQRHRQVNFHGRGEVRHGLYGGREQDVRRVLCQQCLHRRVTSARCCSLWGTEGCQHCPSNHSMCASFSSPSYLV